MPNNNYEEVLKEFGFTQAPWNRCPQGYEPDYPCFEMKGVNLWVEVYKTKEHPYGLFSSAVLKGRKFFDNVKELRELIKLHNIKKKQC